MSKGLWFVSWLLLGAGMAAFGAGEPEAAAASEMEEDYEPGQVYHWATPADYERATGKPVGQFKEAPILSERVAAGVLPPVAERLPTEPLVLGEADRHLWWHAVHGQPLARQNLWGRALQPVWVANSGTRLGL